MVTTNAVRTCDSEFVNSIFSMHYNWSKEASNLTWKKNFDHTCATFSELPFNTSIMNFGEEIYAGRPFLCKHFVMQTKMCINCRFRCKCSNLNAEKHIKMRKCKFPVQYGFLCKVYRFLFFKYIFGVLVSLIFNMEKCLRIFRPTNYTPGHSRLEVFIRFH